MISSRVAGVARRRIKFLTRSGVDNPIPRSFSVEAIAERIERGEITLEESITQYEQGMKLVQHCRDVLAKAEHKIEQLQQRADGSYTGGT